jgi:hypothetical protein
MAGWRWRRNWWWCAELQWRPRGHDVEPDTLEASCSARRIALSGPLVSFAQRDFFFLKPQWIHDLLTRGIHVPII